jgi:membrane associated rhomboid family serine protease
MADHCYRHPDRETGVSCSSCGRPICPDCMTPTPVGMRCPECANQRTRVVQGVGEESGFGAAPATFVLIALNVAAYLVAVAAGSGGLNSPGGSIALDFGLYGPFVAEGEVYRLVTCGFLHAGLIHIGFNMFLLFMLGRMLEPALGTPRFLLLYFVSLLGGSLGALLLDPDALTVGASGAVFGLFGAGFLLARERGLESLASQLGLLILINLAISFGNTNISLGGHLGGLAAGVLCAAIVIAGERGRLGARHRRAEMATMAALAVLAAVASVAIV